MSESTEAPVIELQLQQVARITGNAISTVSGWCDRYDLPSRREGRERLVNVHQLATFLSDKGDTAKALEVEILASIGSDFYPKLVGDDFVHRMIGMLHLEHGMTREEAAEATGRAAVILGFVAEDVLRGPFVRVRSDSALGQLMAAKEAGTLPALVKRWYPKAEKPGARVTARPRR